MKLKNLSGIADGILYSWMPSGLSVGQVVFLPDACPGKSPLPTGTVVHTRQPDWRRYAVSDCGCGMRLLRSNLTLDDLTQDRWDEVADNLQANKGRLGDLGGGNHFLDALLPYEEDNLHFLIHTGSRNESGLVDGLVDSPDQFDATFTRIVDWAAANRAEVQKTLERTFGEVELVLDLPHNNYEIIEDGVIIRKGSVHLRPGDLTVLPSHMSGDVSLLRATSRVEDIMFSMSHGTGRTMARSKAKTAAASYDFAELRQRVLMLSSLSDASLTTEGPFAYRDLDDCLTLIEGYVEEVQRFAVIAYMGHL